MAWLLIDNSNTRTKFRLGNAEGLEPWKHIVPTKALDEAVLSELLELKKIEAVAIASVVPEKEKLIADFFRGKLPYHALTCESPLEFMIDLKHPEQIGHDRLANVNALANESAIPKIAIDFGTAVTCSILSAEKKFLGGSIAPGMSCMVDYLSGNTAQLPAIQVVTPNSPIGETTEEALQIGMALGQRGMIREILTHLLAETGPNTEVVATGGGAEFTAPHIPEISRIDPDLTHEGLRILAKRVFL